MRRRWNDGPGRGDRSVGGSGRRSRWARAGIVAVIGALALGAGNPALAGGQRAFGDVSIFASAPAPGHPFGIAVDDTPGLRLDERRRLLRGTPELGRRAGLRLRRGRQPRADDGHRYRRGLRHGAVRPGARRQQRPEPQALRGRHERPDPAPGHRRPTRPRREVFSQVPISSGLAGDWMKSMWNDLVFDKAGNLYVPDDKPRIWRVGPDGTASIWFTDPRLTGFFGFAGGPLGGTDRPDRPVAVRLDHGVARSPAGVADLSRPAGRPPDGIGPRARPRVPVRPDRRGAAAGDRPRVRQVRQPLRQPDRSEPDRRARPGRRRDPADLQTRCSTRRGASPSAASRCS